MYWEEVYRPAFNAQFMQPALAEGSAFVPRIGDDLDDFLCERTRTRSCVVANG